MMDGVKVIIYSNIFLPCFPLSRACSPCPTANNKRMDKILVEKLHTTELGAERIRKNLCLEVDDVVEWCKQKVKNKNSRIIRKGKNWYASIDDCIITVNAHSYTIITAHKNKENG
jgi:hypothetical protein